MNPNNYGSQKACEKLQKAGIVLSTDFYWHVPEGKEPELLFEAFVGHLTCGPNCKIYPAFSMAEIWRELPLGRSVYTGMTVDDFIDLLIWVRKEGT